MQTFLKYLVYGCLVVVPFLAYYVADGGPFDLLNWGTSGMFFPFISGKNIMFRILVEIALAGWVLLALLNPKYRPKKSPILIAYGVFIVVLFIADMFGENPWRSFWSNFERMEGFIGHIHLFAYFFVFSSMLTSSKEWLNMFKVFIASNLLVLVHGFFQLFGVKGYFYASLIPEKLSTWFAQNFPIHQSEVRLDSTIGNSAYYAVYCLFFAFISAILWTHAKGKGEKWFYGIVAGLNLFSLFYSGTRGTMIGLVVGVVISLGMLAWKEHGKARKMLVIALVAITIALTGIFSMKNTAFIKSSPTLSRLASISPTDLTTMSRLTIWQISFEAWKEKPVFGYGQENFSNIFAKKFIPEKMWNIEPWYDRSHNVFFDWLIAGGIVGLLAYLSLFAAALYLMWVKKGVSEEEFSLPERALLTGLLAGYFIHNIFVFDNLVSYILFILVLAYIVSKTYGGHTYFGTKTMSNDTVTWLIAPIVGIVFLMVFYSVSYKAILTNKLLIAGMDVNRHVANKMPFDQILKLQKESFRSAIDLKVVGSEESREQFLQVGARMAQIQIPPEVPQGEKQAISQAMNDLITAARDEITQSYPKYKDEVRALSIFGMFYNVIGDYPSAEKMLSEAVAISPYKQVTAFDLVRSYLAQRKFTEANDLARRTFLSAPEYVNAMKLYVITAIYANKIEEARNTLASVKKVIPVDNDILSALIDAKQYDVAIALLLQMKKEQPSLGAQIDEYIKTIVARKAGK
jgi:O-antigen ligase